MMYAQTTMHPSMQMGMGMPVVQQPMMGMGGMPMMAPQVLPAPIPSQIPAGTPMGLEFLVPTNRITIQQQVEWGEVLTGINTNNRYHILDAWGRRMYFAAEQSDFCALCCLGNCRPWNISIYSCTGQMVMQGSRESSCCNGCGNSVQCYQPGGFQIGGVIQNCEAVSASWDITDPAGVPILRLEAPSCSVCCPGAATCCEAEFPLMSLTGGQQVGKVTKYFGGVLREAYTAADTFGVEFPVDLDVKVKATLIYATFLIDFMYYEDVPTNDHHHHHYY